MPRLHFQNAQRGVRPGDFPYRSLLRRVVLDRFDTLRGDCCFHWVGKRRMARINLQYLDHRGPTDVITFDLGDEGAIRAEVYICPAIAIEQAREFGATLQDELLRYHLHALLHLAGLDDRTPEQRQAMRTREEELLNHIRSLPDYTAASPSSP